MERYRAQTIRPGQVYLCPEHAEDQAGECTCGLVAYLPRSEAESLEHQLAGAVEKIKGLRAAVNPGDPDDREAAYGHGYLAAVSDALEVLAGGR